MPLGLIECVVSLKHIFNYLFVGLAVKWRVSAQKDVQDNATTPQIAFLVVASLKNFRCDIVRRAILLLQFHVWLKLSRRSKVDDCDSCLLARSIK